MAEAIQSVGTPAAQNQGNEVRVREERDARGRRIFRVETEFVIEGKIQKPTAFVVINRQNINYQWAQLKEGFLSRVADSVNHSPF